MAAPPFAELAGIVGRADLVTDPEIVAARCVDFTGRFRGSAPALVRPHDNGEVAGIVGWCREHGVALVPQGGNTGLVGGSVPLHGELLLGLDHLRSEPRADAAAGILIGGAAVTIGELRGAAEAAGWAYGVDFAARGSATLGGSVATNAGGLRHLRYGDTRRQVLGVEAVLGTGEAVSHLDGLEKDNTGYDLAGLLCGSEGTLGVVTAATVRLVAPAPERVVALLGFATFAAAVAAAAELRRALAALEALEVMFAEGISLVRSSYGLPAPLDAEAPVVLLVEVAGSDDPTADLAEAASGVPGVQAVAVASDAPARPRLWRYRELHTDAINRLGPPHKLDVTVSQAALVPFVEALPATIEAAAPGAELWLFGHLGDGNLHVNVTGADPGDEAVDDAVLRLVASYGGSISAEHGIGSAKRQWLHLNRSEAELRTFRAIKAALDPDGICNPNVLLP